MIWLPWRDRRDTATRDAERARAALRSTQQDAQETDALVADLERIRGANHIAPMLEEAFRMHRVRKGRTG